MLPRVEGVRALSYLSSFRRDLEQRFFTPLRDSHAAHEATRVTHFELYGGDRMCPCSPSLSAPTPHPTKAQHQL